jgi:Flp pilus assembly pilin Flp
MFTNLSLRILIVAQRLADDLVDRFRDDSGQTLAEYGLIMAVIAVAVVVAAGVLFRSAIIGAFNSATKCLSTASTSSSPCG